MYVNDSPPSQSRQFFRRKCQDPSLTGPILIVIATAIANVLSVAVVTSQIITALGKTSTTQLILVFSYVRILVLSIVGVFLMWFAVTAIIYVTMEKLNASQKSFRDLFKLVGWGFTPAVFSGLVSGVATFLVYTQVSFPSDPAQFSALFSSLRNNPIFFTSRLLFVTFTLWQGLLWFFAVKNLYDVSRRVAGGSVVVPTLLWLFLPLSSII
nr:YIP1 family protein [Halomicroarcula amylolytica]